MSSTSIEGRRRPTIWSYLSFSSSPRRRSVSLPTNKAVDNPWEKANRQLNGSLDRSNPLESVKAAWMTSSPRSRVFKTIISVGLLLITFYFFKSSDRNLSNVLGSNRGLSSTKAGGITTCSRPYSSEKPLIQYALMIDAGSTGSRIHVYRFNNCGPTPELEHEEFKMTPVREGGSGLSSYPDDPEGAAKSLDILMDVAVATVPDEYKSCSPVAVKATAGLRLLGEIKSGKILEAVRHRLETVYPFPVISKEKSGVVIMDGRDEGVYAWITTNYLLGKIGGPDKTPTAAVFDLGGGSTQIVFEPTFKSPSKGMPERLQEGDHKYELNFGGRKFELYQHSHLGYGLMSARKAIHQVLIDGLKKAHPNDESWKAQPIENPCIAPGMKKDVTITITPGTETTVTMVGPSLGSTAQCRGLAEKILEKEAACNLAPCSFKGIHQPSLEKTFAREEVYIFSYFYDRTQPLGMPESFTLRELRDLTQRVCEGKESWGVFDGVDGALKELEDRPDHCLDLNFMMALLHTGYELPIDREVRIAKKIKGNELGWCLGASLPLLEKESGWSCKIKEVS